MRVGRPKKSASEMLVEVPCKVPPAVAEAIEEMAVVTDRSRSQIARKLVMRGLAAYRRDGLLDEPEEASISQDAAVAELLAQFGRLPIVYAEDLTPADTDARPVASAKPKHG